jgi:hypothetical protein
MHKSEEMGNEQRAVGNFGLLIDNYLPTLLPLGNIFVNL